MRNIEYIVIHCTATAQTAKVESIQRYWREVMKWKSPGYHFLITPDGEAHQLADISEITNGVKGFNSRSIHISYVGGVDSKLKAIDNRTQMQKATMLLLIRAMKTRFTRAIVQGHRDFAGVHKDCPSFDAKTEYSYIN